MDPKIYQITIAILILVVIFLLYRQSSNNTSTGTTTTKTSSTTTVPVISRKDLIVGTEYIPANYQILEYCADTAGGDIGSMVQNVTLDNAVSNIPAGAVGFVYVPFQLPVTSTSTGNVFYKTKFGVTQDPNAHAFKKVNGVWKYDNYNHPGNDLFDADGTVQEAIKYTEALSLAQGFIFGATDLNAPITLATRGHFYVKDDIGPYVQTNRNSCILYAKSSYTPLLSNFSKTVS